MIHLIHSPEDSNPRFQLDYFKVDPPESGLFMRGTSPYRVVAVQRNGDGTWSAEVVKRVKGNGRDYAKGMRRTLSSSVMAYYADMHGQIVAALAEVETKED